MARKEHGTIPDDGERQPGGTLVYDQNGLVEGTVSYFYDDNGERAWINRLGLEHPDDDAVTLYAVKVTNDTNGIIRADFDCVGISSEFGDQTLPIITFPNTVSTEPIETHPNFRRGLSSDQSKKPGALAGYGDVNAGSTFSKGKTQKDGAGEFLTTGARWNMSAPDPSNGNKRYEVSFAGFIGDETPLGLYGVRAYYAANTMASLTYYTRNTPQLKEPCTIQSPTGVEMPSINGVNTWLHLISSCEMVGKASIWRVTEQYISGTNNVISDLIYKKADGDSAQTNA